MDNPTRDTVDIQHRHHRAVMSAMPRGGLDLLFLYTFSPARNRFIVPGWLVEWGFGGRVARDRPDMHGWKRVVEKLM